MLETILGILVTLLTAFGMGVINFIAFMVCTALMVMYMKKKGYDISYLEVGADSVKDAKEEKTKEQNKE